ncbi:MAG: type II toxin-antitoxin system HicB family antitoxin [Candidatus Magasanikbacteria bacterium]|jgi:predicted RNase H-like HicB family nuclease
MYKNNLQFSVVYQQDEDGGFIATVPALPGCHTQGKDLPQTILRIKEAVDLYIESLKSDKYIRQAAQRQVLVGTVMANG